MKLICATLEPRSELFPISISDEDLVGELKDAIAEKQQYTFPASRLRLYIAVTLSSQWITEIELCRSSKDILMTTEQEMWISDSVVESFNRVIPFDDALRGVIHVLVKLPIEWEAESVDMVVRRELRGARVPTIRRARWDKLNARLGSSSASRKWIPTRLSFESLSWLDLADIYDPIIDDTFVQDVDEIQSCSIEHLLAVIQARERLLGAVLTGKEAKRVLFVELILIGVLELFEESEQLRLTFHETFTSEYVRATGCCDFAIKNNGLTVCIVIASADDLDAALVQAMIGLEVICDIEEREVAWAVITNFKDWIFVQRKDDCIKRDADSLNLKTVHASTELARIAGKVCSILIN